MEPWAPDSLTGAGTGDGGHVKEGGIRWGRDPLI